MNTYDFSFSAIGAFLSFAAFQRATGNAQVVEIYKSCIERCNSGIVKSTTAEWIGRLLAYLISALSAVLAGGYSTGTLEAGIRGQEFTVKTYGSNGDGGRSKLMSVVITFLLMVAFVVFGLRTAGGWLVCTCVRLVNRMFG
ncbi:hypothetical protein K431DRAFT_155936 [Polychaeton citri CBS 116435]|uniref:Uncharacterized protein n=1 Tax=Polychaeton citri CBS 116435 TaxID=1314669 RepID=A0A9P4QG69_9PEZI|nr:hypothetical protein K431DRAFT_155936 [Polychaeton citri CBS 116435]